jgi:hypothetical protein
MSINYWQKEPLRRALETIFLLGIIPVGGGFSNGGPLPVKAQGQAWNLFYLGLRIRVGQQDFDCFCLLIVK